MSKDKFTTAMTSEPLGSRSNIVFLSAAHLQELLGPETCLAALEDMYANLHAAPEDAGKSLGFETTGGKFHVKAGLSPRTHRYFAAKINANYPANFEQFGLPTIQGVIVLSSCEDGRPVAILQSGELTGLRTAAATALAAKHGARTDARRLAMVGCGAQAKHQIRAICGIRQISHISVFDRETSSGNRLASWVNEILGIETVVASSIGDALGDSDICVTSTTSTQAIVDTAMVPQGCFIAAVGADNPDKQELDPAIFAKARILVDDANQCAASGDLAHAIKAGVVEIGDVSATLAQLAAGAANGRTSNDEIVIFDSTGTGVQDVAACAAAYEKALETGVGLQMRCAY